MRLLSRPLAAVIPIFAALAVASPAGALTLGTTTPPAGSSPGTCPNSTIALGVDTSGTETPYIVPVGGGPITRWRVNTTGDTPGTHIDLLVLRAGKIQAVDARTLPNPLPASNVVEFTLSSPIATIQNDTFGLWSDASALCFFGGGSTPASNSLFGFSTTNPPTVGAAAPPAGPGSGPGYELNLAVDVVNEEDVTLALKAGPKNAAVGRLAALQGTVGNNGPAEAPITFSTTLPKGLKLSRAVAGNGTCTTSGRQVTCTISHLASGKSAPVTILVTPSKSGKAKVTAHAVPGVTDPTPASATATLKVAKKPVPARCFVPRLRGTPAGVAKGVLKALGCRIGKVKRVRSHVARGAVVRTSPRGPKTLKPGAKVKLFVSKG